MHKIVMAVFVLVATSCNDHKNGGDALLSEPPYKPLTDSIASMKNNAGLYYRRGSLLYKNNQKEYAEKDIRKAWELQPDEAHALSMTTILKGKSVDEAISFLQQALQKLPNSIALRVALARGYQQKGAFDKALSLCNEIIKTAPGELNSMILKSEILKAQNRNAEALANLEQTYAYAPGDVELVHTLAFDYAEAKNPKVLSLSDSLIRADVEGRHAEPYYFKGVYFANTGNDAEAVRQFDEAIRHDYNFLEAYINKGIVYYDQKNYKSALQSFNLALRIDPSYADAFYWIGKTQEAVGEKGEALQNFQRALSLDTSLKEAKQGIDRLQKR